MKIKKKKEPAPAPKRSKKYNLWTTSGCKENIQTTKKPIKIKEIITIV